MDSRFLAGLGMSAISFFARYAVKDMPRPIAWLGILFGILIMAASATPSTAKYVNGPLIMFAVGCFCSIGSIIWYYVGDFTVPALAGQQIAQINPLVNQNNQSGPNIIAPGGNFNIFPTPQQQVNTEVIYQAGIVVGKVFGGRRLPNDSTTFEFKEITNCAQFNTSVPFYYGRTKLIFKSEQNSALMVIGRTDNPIRFGVLARVLEDEAR